MFGFVVDFGCVVAVNYCWIFYLDYVLFGIVVVVVVVGKVVGEDLVVVDWNVVFPFCHLNSHDFGVVVVVVVDVKCCWLLLCHFATDDQVVVGVDVVAVVV